MYHHSGNDLINPFKLLEKVGIKAGLCIADMGCGSIGHFVFPAAQLVGHVGRVYAVDVRRDALDCIERVARDLQYWNVEPVWSDFEVYCATHIESAVLDMALFINNLFLCKKREAALKEIARLTRQDGKLVVVEWKKMKSPLGPELENRISEEDAKKVLNSKYFEFDSAFDAGKYHYGLVYKRTAVELL